MDHSNAEFKNLAWLDIETTGLREREDAILEIGIKITTKRLEDVDQQNWVIQPTQRVPVHEISPRVFQMHYDSGLWLESLQSSTKIEYLEQLSYRLDDSSGAGPAAFMEQHSALGSPLCGNSVHFDRAFLKAQAPWMLKLFHYRNLDVSSFKNAFRLYGGDKTFEKSGGPAHRALADLEGSVDEFRFYAKALGWDVA